MLPAQLLVRGPLVVNQLFLQLRLGDLQHEADALSGHIVKVDGLTRVNYPGEVLEKLSGPFRAQQASGTGGGWWLVLFCGRHLFTPGIGGVFGAERMCHAL